MNKSIKMMVLAVAVAMTTLAAVAATPAQVIDNLKKQVASDKRTAVWDVKTAKQGGKWTVSGTVGTNEQRDAIQQALNKAGVTASLAGLTVLEDKVPAAKRWAQVKLSVATLRCDPKHSGEVATQGIMGMPVKVLQIDGEWCRVQMPDDYIAYVPVSSLEFKTADQLKAWRSAKRCIVTAHDGRLVTIPGGDETVSDLVLGNIMEVAGEQAGWLQVLTPDGRKGYVEKQLVADFDEWSKQTFDVALIERTARRMMGSGYLWGGTSTKVTDCSGLTKVCYFANGIILQRDASQQALHGKIMKDGGWQQYEAGDLLFFGNSKTGRVTHVGIYLRDGNFIHCSGQVKINSLDPKSPQYLYSPLSASRVNGMVGTTGIVAVRNHPWYF